MAVGTLMVPSPATLMVVPSGFTPPMAPVVAQHRAMVPDDVIVPPLSPVPAVIEVTVPLPGVIEDQNRPPVQREHAVRT